jgi:DNA adenine methylase
MKKKKLRPPIKTHGGKFYLCGWVIQNFPKNYQELSYCEPFCGGGSVFLNKEISPEETLADQDEGVVAIFKSLRDEPKEFINRLKRTKYTESTFKFHLKRSQTEMKDYVDKAVNEYILRRMSRGGLKKAFAWSERLRGGQPGDLNAWKTMLSQLKSISERVQKTNIIHSDFRGVVKCWDEDNSLMYLDPPYLHSTRSENATDAYEHEMTADDHIALLNLIKNARGKVAISGYYSPLYKNTLIGWKCLKKETANHSSQSKSKQRRTECLWVNY